MKVDTFLYPKFLTLNMYNIMIVRKMYPKHDPTIVGSGLGWTQNVAIL